MSTSDRIKAALDWIRQAAATMALCGDREAGANLEALALDYAATKARLARKGRAGRKPTGSAPLTNAERQRRKRAKAKKSD